jgi:hypothetical protein
MSVMQVPEPSIPVDVEKMLSLKEKARIFAVLRDHRRRTIAELGPGARSVVNTIINDARLRHHTFQPPERNNR